MQHIYSWLERKLRGERRRLLRPARAVGEFCRHTGGRTVFGHVTLAATPATEFTYTSRVTWPVGEQHRQMFEDCVMDGILDVIIVQHTFPVLGLAVTLEEISWHEVDSCALGYGMAARQAIERILAPERGALNYGLCDSPSAS